MDPFKKIKDSELKTKFSIGKLIGKGKFGRVYKCALEGENFKYVAIKITNRKKMESKNMDPLIEIQILKNVDTIYAIKLIEYLIRDDYVFQILEYVEGGDLFEKLRKVKRFERCMAQRYIKQIARGLSYLNLKNIMHLDIKAENILIDPENNIKIIDFGLSAFFEPGKKYDKFAGTIFYLSPEMIKRYYDYRTDIWSLGVLYYELIEGDVPFKGDTDMEIVESIREKDPVFTKNFCEKTTLQIKQMLSKDSEDRPSLNNIILFNVPESV